MVLIIGTGAGGSLVARELSKKNIPVTILEKGPFIETKDAYKYYDESDEGVDMLKTTCIGGSTAVSMGNAVRSLEEEFLELGIDLSNYYDYVENLCDVHQLDDSHFGKGTELFMKSSEKLGLNPIKMPKYIREEDCIQCGNCAFGCPKDAKWTGKDFIDDACDNGAKLICDCECKELIIEDNKIVGVKAIKDNEEVIFKDETVILSAGAINSAIILKKAGIPAGKKLITDPFVTMGGYLKDINFNTEVQMNGLVVSDHFVLAPHFSTFLKSKLPEHVEDKDILSIMIKIPDEGKGYITDDGRAVKINTIQDVAYVSEGVATAGAILADAGVDPTHFVSTVFRSAHPAGTAAIGEIVNTNLETDVDGLYVCDASVIPVAPGAPPILLILALSKRLADYLTN